MSDGLPTIAELVDRLRSRQERIAELEAELEAQQAGVNEIRDDAERRLRIRQERIDELEAEVARLDRSETRVLEERDRANEALRKAHVALGGDGEWVARPGQICVAGETGDLAIDVPALASQREALFERSMDRMEEIHIQLDAEVARLRPLARLGWWGLSSHREHMGDLDGGDIQDWAKDLGLLIEVPVTEPCCEDACWCAEWDSFPKNCLRMAPGVEEPAP